MTAQEFESYRSRAKTILGYMPIKTPCPTCKTPDDEIPKESKLPSRKCLIRLCVNKAGVQNCAFCARFPCDTLKATAGLWNRASIEKRLGSSISDEDYHSFVEPFEGLRRLESIRQTLKPQEIVEPAKVSMSRAKIAVFPDNLPFPKQEIVPLKAVYDLIVNLEQSSLELRGIDTFAQMQKLENLRAHVLRFLWIMSSYGHLDEEGNQIVVDAQTYLANRGSEKTLAIWSFVENTLFKALSQFGLHCEQIVLKGFKAEDLTTGTGYLRNKGWVMALSFEETAGGIDALKALQTYSVAVSKKYGEKAFKGFREADMRFLSNYIELR
jgi:hypothetical protein